MPIQEGRCIVSVVVDSLEKQLEKAYICACECELTAFKPGNVSIYSEGHGMTVDDFRRSARVSAPFLVDFNLSLGEKIFYAIQATQAEVGCNTNLGIVLLCAPLLQSSQGLVGNGTLQNRLQQVLNTTTQDDAAWVYRAIRLAKPAGLGESTDQDVTQTPQVNLTEAMRIAGDRDRIAYQYVSNYEDIFDFALTKYHNALDKWGDENWSAVAVFFGLLLKYPDSHVERKYGNQFTGMVTTRIALLDEELSKTDRPERLIRHLKDVDDEFKSAGINPGTTADLTVACLLAVRLELLLDYDADKSTMLS